MSTKKLIILCVTAVISFMIVSTCEVECEKEDTKQRILWEKRYTK